MANGFPDGSDSKESTRNVGDLGWEGPLEKGMVTHSSILAWRIPWTEKPGGYSPWGHKEWDMTERLSINTHVHTHTRSLHMQLLQMNSLEWALTKYH